jgi:paraquat-inducible protein B
VSDDTPSPQQQPRGDDAIPRAVPQKPGLRWLQPVWIIPIVAIVIGAWLAFQHIIERGPTITIRFRTAEGLEAGKTRIKYKDVDIGIVKKIELDDDRKTVVVTAEMVKQASRGLLVDDTRFWVVRPRISGGRVSGLGTLLAGAYIGTEPGKNANERRDFTGLETPPVVTSDLPGRTFILGAGELGSIDINSPVYYRGAPAGQVVSTEVSKDGKQVNVGIFVQSPFDTFVTSGSRFWNASGIDLEVGASGVRVDTQSLATIVIGGIAFETPAEALALPRAAPNARFILWPDRTEAAKVRETVIETYRMVFDDSVRGLAIGAPVDFRGVVLGEVADIDLEFDPARTKFRPVVQIRFFPERLRSRSRDPARPDRFSPTERMQRFVAAGFRGQLRSSNLLTGQLYIALDFFPNQPKLAMDTSKVPPEIPTVQGSLAQIQESLAAIVKKIEKIPFEELSADVRRGIAELEKTLKSVDRVDANVIPELQRTLDQARRTLSDAQKTISSDSPIATDLRDTLQEVTRAADSLRMLTDYLERQPDALIRGRREGGSK